jgi:hypothetical protein
MVAQQQGIAQQQGQQMLKIRIRNDKQMKPDIKYYNFSNLRTKGHQSKCP